MLPPTAVTSIPPIADLSICFRQLVFNLFLTLLFQISNQLAHGLIMKLTIVRYLEMLAHMWQKSCVWSIQFDYFYSLLVIKWQISLILQVCRDLGS
ncbi:hypothetical protein XELAEV_18003864mg [Xenopus laevis]|uniref:Uncharacterized protein n=1 Tax=Xenopus laevis TaxID=8355 RepID=A0A974BPA1_XENLA|nr:hypothetical protein XELAEV_18003864mg [Xenopus laevis]